MQEEYRNRPWALLVGCILFNMVHGSKARPILEQFLKRWPDPEAFLHEKVGVLDTELKAMLRPLGFQNRRADRILHMTIGWMVWRPDLVVGDERLERVKKLHGVGKYGQDSYRIFCMGELIEDAEDKELKRYVEWAKEQ